MKQILQNPTEVYLKNKNVFQAISKKLSKPYEVYTVNQEKDNVIITQSGSIIHIPQRVFEHKNGQLLSGKIDIYYREIRTAADIIANGIDMRIKTADGNYSLQTSGMFEIQGFQNNNKINIKNNKEITVDFVSNSKKEFDNYYYNEKTKNWEKSDKTNTELIPYILPVKKEKSDFIVKQKIDVSNLNQLNKYPSIQWKYIGSENISNIQQKISTINFHNKDIKVVDEKLMLLELNLSSKTAKDKLSLQLKPVFDEKDYNTAKEIYETQNKLIKEVEQKRKKLLNSNYILNSFSVRKFSFQNCDIVYRYPNHKFTNASFKIGNNFVSKNLEIYLISGDDNIVIKFANDFSKFNFNPNLDNKIIGIIPNETLAVMTSEDLQKTKINENTIFELKEVSKSIENLENFNSLINKL